MRKNAEPLRTTPRDHVASLDKGLQVLTCFDRQHSRLTITETARLTASTPASARRALLTLQALGYLDSDGKRFWMQPRALLIAHAYLSSRPAPSVAQPLLDGLSERTRESASLGELLGDHAIIVARSTARRSLSSGLGIGSRLPAYCSALGRVLLAGLPPGEMVRRVHAMQRLPLTPYTETDAERIVELIDRCRDEGFASNEGELEQGVRSMAVPVFNRSGERVAALAIAMQTERMEHSAFRETFLPALHRASEQLTRRL